MTIEIEAKDGKMVRALPAALPWVGLKNGLAVTKEAPVLPALSPWETDGWTHAPWGSDDMLPTNYRKKLESSSIAAAAIQRKVAMMFGNGIAYFRTDDLATGQAVTRAYIKEVEDFLFRNNIRRWFLAQLMDWNLLWNTFSQVIFSKDRKTVTNLYHMPAEFCRLSKQNTKNWRIEYVLMAARFADGVSTPREEDMDILPLYRFFEDNYVDGLRKNKMAWHTKIDTPGITYYAKPPWYGLFKDRGWIDVSAEVPKIVSSMQLNQVALKYHIKVPDSYFEMRHPEWQNYTAEERTSKFNELVEKINQTLSGSENWAKSISQMTHQVPGTGETIGALEITPIDDKIRSGGWVPDSNAADAQIAQGLLVHPSQIGLQPSGGKMGAGSGSDQRESYNAMVQLHAAEVELLMEPLNWVSRFNGWGVTFTVSQTVHTTTNNQESGLVDDDLAVTVE